LLLAQLIEKPNVALVELFKTCILGNYLS
jgi:hypothetical protein